MDGQLIVALIREGGGYFIAAVALLALAKVWSEWTKERLRNDALNEKRIEQLQVSLESVTKAVEKLDNAGARFAQAVEIVARSHET